MEDTPEKGKKVTHKAVVTWDKEKEVFLCSLDKRTIEIAESPESKKHEDMWTPEELFIASVEGFLKDSFANHAKRNDFEFLSYKSKAEGTIEKINGKLAFSEIKIKPRITVSSNQQIEKAIELIELAEKDCFKSDFITAKIIVCPEIRVGL
jgi:organic hydroperoxide reductase OsmC/OhrA